ncbi:MAG: hypothetical protein JSW21_13275, partial [Gammaproteobacteria bacterium]
EERLIRILAWSSFTAARNFARIVAERVAVVADESDIRAVAQLQTSIKGGANRPEGKAQVRYA